MNSECNFIFPDTGDSNNINSRRSPEKLIPYVTNVVIQIILRVLACIYVVLVGLGRFFVVRFTDSQSRSLNKSQITESKSNEPLVSQETRDPLWQRLQNLEAAVTEMVNKPTTIPPEKDDILHESLNRIKCIEYDLQKTKKVIVSHHMIDQLKDITQNCCVNFSCYCFCRHL